MKYLTPYTKSAGLLAVLLLAACNSDNNPAPEGHEPKQANAAPEAIFSPFTGALPLPINLLFNAQPGQPKDGTLNIPRDSAPVLAANQLDGWSTIAPISINFSAAVDADSAATGIRLLHMCVDPATKAPISPAASPYVPDKLVPGTDYLVEVSGIDVQQILVKPKKPLRSKFDPTGPCVGLDLNPSNSSADPAENGYIVVVNNKVTSTEGDAFVGSGVYQLLQNKACFYRFVANDPSCSNTGPEGTTAEGEAAGVAVASVESQQKTEKLRRLVNAQEALASAFSQGALNGDNIILSFSFSTQSMDLTMQAVKANAIKAAEGQKLEMLNTGITTDLAGFSGGGVIYKGTITVPYYLPLPSHKGDMNILTGHWKNANGDSPNFIDPVPVKTGDVTIPVLGILPIRAYDDGGFTLPVTIIQHGITTSRLKILALADKLAGEGIATLAIDLPLHGITDQRFPKGDFRVAYNYEKRIGERTFDIDLLEEDENVIDICDPKANPAITKGRDSSGKHFVNLASLLTSRDNLRQAVADLLVLEQLAPKAEWLWKSVYSGKVITRSDTDAEQVNFVGHSLGGMVGATFAAFSSNIKSATFVTGGGGIAKLLDISATFGPRVSAGLAANGVKEGTLQYEQFLTFAQTAVDSADPLNYASRISIPTYQIIVTGGAKGLTTVEADTQVSHPSFVSPPDLVVPNDAFAAKPEFGEIAPVSGLGGSLPLADVLEQTRVMVKRDTCKPETLTAVNHAALFDSGSHATLLRPNNIYPNPADPEQKVCVVEKEETAEMHNQILSFVASNGKTVQINSDCPQK